MTSFLHPLLADLSSLPWIAIIAIIGSFLMGPVIIFIVFQSIQRRQQMWHDTARVALEKGQPLPPMPADVAPPKADPTPRARNDVRTGLILIAVGAGLYVFLGTLVGRGLGLVGAIPGFIGIALFLFGLVEAFSGPKNNPPPDQPRV
jgi:hypothetical protein